MSNTVKVIPASQLKPYVVVSRSCGLGATCDIEPKFGNITLNFSSFPNAERVVFEMRRKSGNGKVVIVSGKNVAEHGILSKSSQSINVALDENLQVIIKRPPRSSGNVELLKVTLFTDSEQVQRDLSVALSRALDYKSVKLTDNKLFALTGAYIKTAGVKSILTDPPDMFNIDNNIIRFKGDCRVIDLDLKPAQATQKTIYKHIDNNNEDVVLAPSENNNIKNNKYTQRARRNISQDISSPQSSSNIIYDSKELGSWNKHKNIGITGNASISTGALKISNKGSVAISISKIEPGHQYILVLEGELINGNGKFYAHIDPPDSGKLDTLILNKVRRNINIKVNSGMLCNQDDVFYLKISRPIAATGEIAIYRMMLVSSQEIIPGYGDISKYYSSQPANEKYIPFSISDDFTVTTNDPVKAHGEYKMPKNENIKFVVVIPSYKNEQWVEKNLNSVFNQTKDNYRVIFIDDCSPDKTFEKANQIVKSKNQQDRTTLIKNKRRKGALRNLYHSIHECDDNEIIITVDGDDWLAHDKVIEKLTDVYSDPNTWMTYGQYKSYPDNGKGCSQQIPAHITRHNLFRQFRWCSSHLRTFYAWLFKKIKKEDLLDKTGNFYPMAWDLSFQLPHLELSGFHAKFIPDILYIYNVANPINDSKVNLNLQQSLEREIRAKPKYNRL